MCFSDPTVCRKFGEKRNVQAVQCSLVVSGSAHGPARLVPASLELVYRAMAVVENLDVITTPARQLAGFFIAIQESILKKASRNAANTVKSIRKGQSVQAPTVIEAVPVFNWNAAGGWASNAIWLPVAQQIEMIFLYPDDVQIWLRKDGALELHLPGSGSKILLCNFSLPQLDP